jgi:hypothetical protein
VFQNGYFLKGRIGVFLVFSIAVLLKFLNKKIDVANTMSKDRKSRKEFKEAAFELYLV